MERGGTRGCFHGYGRSPQASSGGNGMKLPAEAMMMNTSTTNNNLHQGSSSATDDSECTVREQDRFMPIANVIRIMRKILPPHAKISDDAKETIQECVSEFISFITGEANDRCQREQRKTITAEDVLWAMSKLGFDDYIEPLTLYLNRYREFEGDRGSIRSEPLVKRAVEVGAPSVAAYGPAFHLGVGIGHHHHGFFGVGPASSGVGGFFKDNGSNAGPSAAMAEVLEPYNK